ncbi:hypothetical protein GO755_35025 [Spirosoma sp. HMF4905]|uniref:Uncharacterized protein n=1 Tax=Spirosoma arboris TaxID=2682092 RepID=A0A7K1SNB2_9BACT|nr:hypothetical protein [Spirosoma arboris]MVM35288.1 hypothetical protein [Spirosoma arboris]
MEATNGIRGDARAEWLTNNRDAAKILDGYIVQAERAFIQRIEQAGLKLTGEMLNSFRAIAAKEAGVFVESRLEMAGLFRLKDLRSMNYSRTPPLVAMEAFVEKVGVSRFAYVPGYPTAHKIKPASELASVERIAWAIKINRQCYPSVKREYRGIYSDPLLKDVLPYLYRDLATASNLTALRAYKAVFSQS